MDRPGAPAGNHALDVPYAVTSYGGFSDNLSTPGLDCSRSRPGGDHGEGVGGDGATAALTSNAEHSVLIGQPAQAIAGFSKAYKIASSIRRAAATASVGGGRAS